MGLFNKLGNIFSNQKNDKEEKKTILVSNDKGYQAQAKRHTAVHNKLEAKKRELDGLLNIKQAPLKETSNENEEDIYAKNELKQKEAQSLIKTSFYKLLNQRQIFTNVINKLNKEWPEREPEVIDMMIDSEKEVTSSDEIRKNWNIISQGKDPSVENDPLKMSKMYDMGKAENKEKYDEMFKEPIFSTKRKRNP